MIFASSVALTPEGSQQRFFFFLNKRKPSQFIICVFLSCVVKISNRVHLCFVSRFTSVYQSGVTLRCVHSQIKSDLDFTAPGRGSSSKTLPLVKFIMSSSVCPGLLPLFCQQIGPALWAGVVSNTARYPPARFWSWQAYSPLGDTVLIHL